MKGKKQSAKDKQAIPNEVKKQVDEIVLDFNRKVLQDPNYYGSSGNRVGVFGPF